MAALDCLKFVRGEGSATDHTACIMSAARILAGEATEADKRDDACSRVSPEIRRFAIGVNDWGGWKSDEERTEHLCKLVPALLDTVAPRDVVQRRLWILADVAVRACAPVALEARADLAKRYGNASAAALLRDHAGRIRACDEIVDRSSALRAREVCRTAAAAAAAAAAHAYADAAAAADAYAHVAAAAYAAAAAAAAHAYADAADAAAYAAADAAAAAAAAAHVAAAAYAAAYADAAAAAAAHACCVAAADDLVESRRAAILDALVGALARVCAVRA